MPGSPYSAEVDWPPWLTWLDVHWHLTTYPTAKVWVDLLAMAGGVLIVFAVISLLSATATLLAPQWDPRDITLAMLPLQALGVVGVVAMVLNARGQSAASVGLSLANPLANAALGVVAALAAWVAVLLGANLLQLIWPASSAAFHNNAQKITDALPPRPILLIALQIVVAFYEELLFRGFLLTRLRRLFHHWWPAVLISSVIFAAPHIAMQEAAMIVPLFFVGATFALFTVWRGTLLPAMIGHALWNIGNIAVLYYGPTLTQQAGVS